MASQGLRNLGRSGLRVSPLCLGAMNFGNEQFGCDEQTSIGVIHAYLGAGHNFIDTANVYSGTRSETIVGKAVKDRRDAVVIATRRARRWDPARSTQAPAESTSSRPARTACAGSAPTSSTSIRCTYTTMRRQSRRRSVH